MPNFEAKIRRDYADINGLVLDLNALGIVADPVTNRVSRWRNDAPPRIRSIPSYARYKDALQAVATEQPLLGITGGIPHVAFDNALGQHMSLDMFGDFGADKEAYTFSYELDVLGGDITVNQSIFGTDEVDLFAIGTPNTTRGYRLDATTDFDAGVSPADTVTVYQLEPGGMNRFENGSPAGGGAAAPVTLGDSTLNPVATLGGNNSGSGFFDGNIRNMRVWNRELQDNEISFAFQTLASDPAVDYSTGFAEIETRVWNDATALPPRVNPTLAAAHLFTIAKIPSGGTGIIQFEATIGGVVLPDTALGGDLFALTALETPRGIPPLVTPVAVGWSSVQEVRVDAVGHYTLEFRRTAGGAIVFHVDVENL